MAKGARIIENSKKSEPAKLTQAQGIDYLYENFGILDPWDVGDLNVEKINKFRDNVYAQKISSNLTNQIFQGRPVYNILDPEGNSDENVAMWFREMLNSELVDFEDKLHKTIESWMFFGTFLHSDTIAEEQGKIILKEIRDLPPESFANPGYNTGFNSFVSASIIASGKILPGIMRYQDGSVHYWQTQLQNTVELENCQHIKSPKYSYYIDGVPLLAPLYKLIPKINAAWDQLMQCGNRANCLFLRVNRIATMPDNKTSNWTYSNKVLSSYNHNVFFTLPPDVEPVELKGPVSDISIQTIELLTKLIISLYSSSDFVAKEGTLISGSSAGETNLFKNAIIGIQTKLLKAWTPLLNKILEWNGYVGYSVEIKIPEPKFKNEQLDFQRAQLIVQALKEGHVIATENELRSLLGLEDASVEFLKKSVEEWEELKIEIPTPVNPMMQNADPGQKPAGISAPTKAKNSGNSQKQENSSQTEVKDGQNQLKKNQDNITQNSYLRNVTLYGDQSNVTLEGNQSEEEIQEELLSDLKLDIQEFFGEIRKLRGLA